MISFLQEAAHDEKSDIVRPLEVVEPHLLNDLFRGARYPDQACHPMPIPDRWAQSRLRCKPAIVDAPRACGSYLNSSPATFWRRMR